MFILSRGHSATTWVSKQISKHNKVVCWHGTRSIPPAVVGINDISPEDFVKGLKILEKQKMKEFMEQFTDFMELK